jgi:putative phage-type endonuclease
MKIIKDKDLPQGSQEWLDVRSGYGMASEVGALLGVSKWEPKTPLSLYKVKTGETIIKTNFAMNHGNKYEDEARQMFEDDMGATWEPVVVLNEDLQIGASLDGWREKDNSVLEIKCPLKGASSDLWTELSATDRIPEQYWLQCQQQMLVTGSERLYFWVYDVNNTSGLMKVIKPNKKAQDSIENAWNTYWNNQPPLATTADVIENPDVLWADAAREWKEVSIALSELKKREASLKESLIEMAEGQSMTAGGVQMKVSSVKGRINYKLVPELDGIDLEKYRDLPSTRHYFKVTEEKQHA